MQENVNEDSDNLSSQVYHFAQEDNKTEYQEMTMNRGTPPPQYPQIQGHKLLSQSTFLLGLSWCWWHFPAAKQRLKVATKRKE